MKKLFLMMLMGIIVSFSHDVFGGDRENWMLLQKQAGSTNDLWRRDETRDLHRNPVSLIPLSSAGNSGVSNTSASGNTVVIKAYEGSVVTYKGTQIIEDTTITATSNNFEDQYNHYEGEEK